MNKYTTFVWLSKVHKINRPIKSGADEKEVTNINSQCNKIKPIEWIFLAPYGRFQIVAAFEKYWKFCNILRQIQCMCASRKHQSDGTVKWHRPLFFARKTFSVWLIVMVYQKFNISNENRPRLGMAWHDNKCSVVFHRRHVANVKANISHVSMQRKNRNANISLRPQSTLNSKKPPASLSLSVFFIHTHICFSGWILRFYSILYNMEQMKYTEWWWY